MGVYRPHTDVPGNSPAEAALLAAFSELLAAGGSETTVVPEIQRVKFAKNLWNGVLGASAALSHSDLRAFFRPPHLEPARFFVEDVACLVGVPTLSLKGGRSSGRGGARRQKSGSPRV